MPQSHLYLLATERPLINIDATVLVTIVLWLVLFGLLRALLWGPMIRLITAREAGTEGSRLTARKLETEARAKEVAYRTAQRNARAMAAAERDRLRAEALRHEADVLTAARAQVNATLEVRRAQIQGERARVEAEIKATVPQLAREIAAKVLGREVAS
jgi:F-type H+-transporting ATPase subunit b